MDTEVVTRRTVIWLAVSGSCAAALAISYHLLRGSLPVLAFVVVVLSLVSGAMYELAEARSAERKQSVRELFERSRKEAERFTEIANTQSDVVLNSIGTEALMLLIVDRLVRSVRADDANVMMHSGDAFVVTVGVGRSSTAVGKRISLGRNLASLAFSTAGAVHTADAQNDERDSQNTAQRRGTRSFIAVPLFAHGEVAGVLSVSDAAPNRFEDVDIATVKLFAAQINAALSVEDEARRASDSSALREQTLDAIEAGVVYYDRDAQILSANSSASRILNGALEALGPMWRQHEVVQVDEAGKPTDFTEQVVKAVIKSKIPQIGRVIGLRVAGRETAWLAVNLRPLDQFAYAAICSFSDISEFKRDAETQRHLANHDRLTGLPNRQTLFREINGAIYTNKRIAIAFIDFDGFKSINDDYGHATGDEVLIIGARRMREALGAEDLLCRLGGDEFAAIVACNDDWDSSALIQALTRAFDAPLQIRERTLSVSISIGVATIPNDGNSAEEILQVSDQRMYKMKGRLRSRR